MIPLIVRYDADLRRVWVLGLRLHHGFAGALCVAIGAGLCWHDRLDFPWLRDDITTRKGGARGR